MMIMTKQYIKQRISLLAAAIILCALTACGSKSDIQILEHPSAQPEYLSFFSLNSLFGKDITKYWTDRFTEQYDRTVYINFDGAAYYADEGLTYRELLERRLGSSRRMICTSSMRRMCWSLKRKAIGWICLIWIL